MELGQPLFESPSRTSAPARMVRAGELHVVLRPYDEAFREAHHVEQLRLFPLTDRCNATYDLVPAWVNPAIVVFGILLLVSVVGALSTWGRRPPRSSERAS